MLWSKSQVDKLGDRLRKAAQPSEGDLTLYEEMCERYEVPLAAAVEALEACGFVVTTRFPKTAGTLIEKLKRDRTRLSTIQDVAGARIVVDGDRDSQDDAVECIRTALADVAECEVVDRRENPSVGYRAVHVIARVDGVAVEIQVRTVLQDGWANMMEKFADIYGRQVRYGEPPTDADVPINGREDFTPTSLHALMLELTDLIDNVEETRRLINQPLPPELVTEILDVFEFEGPMDELSSEAIARQLMADRLQIFEARLEKLLAAMGDLLESVER